MLSLVPRLSISADLNRFAINGKTFRVKFVRVEEVKHFRRLIIGGSSEIKNRSNALPLIADKFSYKEHCAIRTRVYILPAKVSSGRGFV